MDPALRSLIDSRTPKINPLIANGLAVREMRFVEEYIDSTIRDVERDFPDGLRYVDYRRLTPIEEYIRVIQQNSKTQFDVARSDVYMIVLNFEFKGEKIVKPLYLPYVRPGGLITLRGSTFAISPVLADKGISLGTDSAFVQISKAKLTFNRTRHHFVTNGERRAPNVVHSQIHNRRRQSQHPKTILMHYLFAKYGVYETFRRFNGTDIRIGDESTINPNTCPPSEWKICHSFGRKPSGLRTNYYRANHTRIAIRAVDFDTVSEAMIAGFFYIVDYFPNRVQAEYLDGSKHEIRLWRILLGLIIGGVTGGEGSIKEDMDDHMESLDSYIDSSAKASLARGDIYVNDFYELLYYVLEILSQMVVQSTETITSLYDKQLMVLRYVLKDVNEGINRMLFRLKKTAKKKELTFTDVSNIIRRQPRTDDVLKMNNGGKHGEVNSISVPGDNMFFKVSMCWRGT